MELLLKSVPPKLRRKLEESIKIDLAEVGFGGWDLDRETSLSSDMIGCGIAVWILMCYYWLVVLLPVRYFRSLSIVYCSISSLIKLLVSLDDKWRMRPAIILCTEKYITKIDVLPDGSTKVYNRKCVLLHSVCSHMMNWYSYITKVGARGCVVVKALRYKPAGRGFDSR